MILPQSIEKWLSQMTATFKSLEAYLDEATKEKKDKNRRNIK